MPAQVAAHRAPQRYPAQAKDCISGATLELNRRAVAAEAALDAVRPAPARSPSVLAQCLVLQRHMACRLGDVRVDQA